MQYIRKKIAPWEIKYGQIRLSGDEYEEAKELLQPYFGVTFTLETFSGEFKNRHILDEDYRSSIRLSCKKFFTSLNAGDEFFIIPINASKIKITNVEPQILEETDQVDANIVSTQIDKLDKESLQDLIHNMNILLGENNRLRKQNQELLKYKERIEKYQNLNFIFEDEKFLEDWLERNIHKALPSLEVLERQVSIVWEESFMRNRPDFFCLDKTTKELVIVENKVRGRFRRLETQYLTYTAWVKNHLAEINEKYKENGLNATDDFKFVIITDTTDERLEIVCETHTIPLILIDGGVIFEEIVPYYFE